MVDCFPYPRGVELESCERRNGGLPFFGEFMTTQLDTFLDTSMTRFFHISSTLGRRSYQSVGLHFWIASLCGIASLLLVSPVAFASVTIDGLLVVESVSNRVLLLDAADGTILNDRLIDDQILQTPVNAIDSGRNTIFISDQLLDEVREYSVTGQYLRTVVNASQVDNIRGIATRNGALYVTVAGSNAGAGIQNTVQRFDLTTGAQSTFIAADGGTGSVVLGSPWDVTFRDSDVLVSDSGADLVLRFDLNGNFLSPFDLNIIGFPQQVTETPSGDILVGNSTSGGGLLRFESDGTFRGAFAGSNGVNNVFSARGVAELEDGRYLYGSGINLIAVNPLTGASQAIISENGRSFRFIERVTITDPTAIPEPSVIATLFIGVAAYLYRQRRRASVVTI